MFRLCCLTFIIFVSWTLPLVQGQTVSVPPIVYVNEDAGSVTITLTHTPTPTALWGAVRETMADTATPGQDYTELSSAPVVQVVGVATLSINIDILDDDVFDPNESFLLLLTSVTGTVPEINVTIIIVDNERPPVNLTQIEDVSVRESVGSFSFNISRNDATTHAFNVTVDTMDSTMGNPATAGDDYTPLSSLWVSFADGENVQIVSVNIIDDTVAEDMEWFCVVIYGPQLFENYTFYIKIIDNDTPDDYNCNRGTSQPCLNMGTCNSNGSCTCESGFEGENCGIATANSSTACTQCVNGTCTNNGMADVCVCDGGFAGDACDRPAYFHQCDSNGFSVCITPFSVATFNGVMYVLGKFNVSECTLAPAPVPSDPDDNLVDWCRGYALFIEYNGTCGLFGPTENEGVTIFQVALRVQYSPTILMRSDELVTLTCQFRNDSLQSSTNFEVNPDSSDVSVQRENNDFVPAELTVTDANDNPITGDLEIGAIIKIYISVEQVDALDGVVLDRVVANNARTGADFRFLELYNRGCFPSESAGLITEGPVWVPSTRRYRICFKLEVFYFIHDENLSRPSIQIVVDFTVYADAADAVMHTCGSRRKRQAVRSEENRLKTTLTLINPDATKSAKASCSCSNWLVPAVISLGVIAITMAVITVALTIAVCRHYKAALPPYVSAKTHKGP